MATNFPKPSAERAAELKESLDLIRVRVQTAVGGQSVLTWVYPISLFLTRR